jgi:peptidoglycan/xylan/chitin deacetylase (PgdA/CDA1 family)
MKNLIANKNWLSSLFLFVEKELSNNLSKKNNKIALVLSFLLFLIICMPSVPIVYAHKAIILNFDDDWKGQITHSVPILEKYGFNATFFVTTGCLTYQNTSFCNNAGGNSAMTWEDIASLSEMGYDIQSHGASHKDLTTVSVADLEYEVGGSKQALLEHGYNSTIFGPAFAAGEGNSTIIDTISKYYDMARVGYAPLVYLDSTDRYSLPVWVDYDLQLVYRDNSTRIFDVFVETINSQAQYNTNGTINAIPIIVYHNIDYKIGSNSSNIPSEWIDSTTDVNLFDREMKYLHDNGFQVLSITDLGYNQTSDRLYIKNSTDADNRGLNGIAP